MPPNFFDFLIKIAKIYSFFIFENEVYAHLKFLESLLSPNVFGFLYISKKNIDQYEKW